MITWHAQGISFRYCIKIFSLTISATKNLSGCSLTMSCEFKNKIKVSAAHERNVCRRNDKSLMFLSYLKFLTEYYSDSQRGSATHSSIGGILTAQHLKYWSFRVNTICAIRPILKGMALYNVRHHLKLFLFLNLTVQEL